MTAAIETRDSVPPARLWETGRHAVGLMSGTSLDGVDAALLRTDGETWVETGAALSLPYEAGFRAELYGLLGCEDRAAPAMRRIEEALTRRHAEAVKALLARAGLPAEEVGLIGFHGQTLAHDPARRLTLQLGDGAALARLCGIPVIADFRAADVAAGGQGAPFAPLYHAALATGLERPLAVLNLGGVGNVTWLGEGPQEIVAFDTGPGNALLDDWAARHTGEAVDRDGALAAAGRVDEAALAALMADDYFVVPPPKSLDREDFDPTPVARLSAADGAATLTAFTAASVAAALPHLAAAPRRWLVTGGGRRNPSLMARLHEALGAPVEPVEAVGWNGDALEAQAFAYLAVRSLLGLPLSLPTTTGVPRPITGGVLHEA